MLRAATCDKNAVMPDELFSLPVTALGDRALSARSADTEGEHVVVKCGVPEAEFDNSAIETLTLPRKLRSIGDYALLDCRALKTLRLNDCLESLGVSVFMNCRSFEKLCITRGGHAQGIALAGVVREFNRTLDVCVTRQGGGKLRLIFPEYYEVQTENEPTHFFNYTIEGGGYPYRHVFTGTELREADFDALWKKYLSSEHEAEEALRLAWYRLRYPAGLSARAQEGYAAYIGAHMREAMALVLRERDIEGLRLLFDTAEPRAEQLSSAMDISRELGFTEATAMLLEQRHRRFGRAAARSYEL